jgi:translation initiation factor IF-3
LAGCLRGECVAVGNRFLHKECPTISTNFRHNEQIRISPVFLIDAEDNKVGPTSTAEALRRAREQGLDLVEVAPNARPPVCKIMDYGKWRYQQQKKADKSRASVRGGQLKEIKMKTVKIGDHDLNIKINHAREFLKEGNKVQFTLQFRGRELAHIDLGRDIFAKIKTELWQVSKVERDAKMEGKRMILVLQPDHKADKAPPPPGQQQGGQRTSGASRPAVSGSSMGISMPAANRPAPVAAAAAQPAPVAQPAGTQS